MQKAEKIMKSVTRKLLRKIEAFCKTNKAVVSLLEIGPIDSSLEPLTAVGPTDNSLEPLTTVWSH